MIWVWCASPTVMMYLLYIMQITQTTKLLFKKCSHSQKHEIQIFKWPSPSSSPKVVLHTFRQQYIEDLSC